MEIVRSHFGSSNCGSSHLVSSPVVALMDARDDHGGFAQLLRRLEAEHWREVTTLTTAAEEARREAAALRTEVGSLRSRATGADGVRTRVGGPGLEI